MLGTMSLSLPAKSSGLSVTLACRFLSARWWYTLLYICMNLMYLNVLSISEIAFAENDRVALSASTKLFGSVGTTIIALLVMVSTFGCNNGLILSGARVYSTMAKDGLFIPAAARLNSKGVPGVALWMQCIWASVLCLSGQYGALLDYIVFVVLIFYILTIGGIFVLRRKQPDLPRPYKAFGYPLIPALYIALASFICIVLLKVKTDTTWPGLIIVILGVPVYLIVKAMRPDRSAMQ